MSPPCLSTLFHVPRLVEVWIPSVIKKGRGPDSHHVYQVWCMCVCHCNCKCMWSDVNLVTTVSVWGEARCVCDLTHLHIVVKGLNQIHVRSHVHLCSFTTTNRCLSRWSLRSGMFTGDTQSLGSSTARYTLDITPTHTHMPTTSHMLLPWVFPTVAAVCSRGKQFQFPSQKSPWK